MSAADAATYHHGDLPTALKEAAVDVIIERGGPANLSLREVARRAGVSHAAPAHHFGDKSGLLTSLAADGFERLAEALRDARMSSDDAEEQLNACGAAYFRVALASPGHYSLMIACDLVDYEHPAVQTASLSAYGQLAELVTALADRYNPDLDPDTTATLIWASVHGLVQLSPKFGEIAESTGTTETPLDDLVRPLTDLLINGIRSG